MPEDTLCHGGNLEVPRDRVAGESVDLGHAESTSAAQEIRLLAVADHHFPEERRARLTILALAIIGFAFLVAPRLVGWPGAHLHKEDGVIFLHDFAYHGWDSLFYVYSGYIHVAPRAVVGLVSTVLPHAEFAAGLNVGTALLRVLFFVLAIPLMSTTARSWRWGVAAASVFLFVPAGQHEVLGNVTNLRWFLVAIASVILLSNYREPWANIVGGLVAVAAAMSDPLVLLLVPLAALRVFTNRRLARLPAAMLMLGCLVQLSQLVPSSRSGSGGYATLLANPGESVVQVLIRGLGVAQYGMTGEQIVFRVGGLPLALIALLLPILVFVAAGSRWRKAFPELTLALVLGVLGLLLLGATLTFADFRMLALNVWWAVTDVSRYSVLAGLFLIPSLLLCCKALWESQHRRGRVIAVVCCAVLALAVVADFRGDPYSTHGPTWQASLAEAQAACADGQQDPRVQFTPDNVPLDWSAPLPCDWLKK